MYKTILFLILGLWITLNSITYGLSQHSNTNFDATIVNGKHYSLNAGGIGGSLFLMGNEFVSGTVTIKEKNYSDLLLNYDIFSQQLVLKFNDSNGSSKLIALSDAWITNFSLESKTFTLIPDFERKKIYQSFGNDDLQILIAYTTAIIIDSSSGKYSYTKPKSEAYLRYNGKISRFRGNKSFAKAFGSENYISVRNFLKQKKINISKANDSLLDDIVKGCNTIIQK
jgi:hypothetical protein